MLRTGKLAVNISVPANPDSVLGAFLLDNILAWRDTDSEPGTYWRGSVFRFWNLAPLRDAGW